MENPARDQLPEEMTIIDELPVRVDLPWVPLPSGERAFLTQVVLSERAPAIRDAIQIYMECRAQPGLDSTTRRELTIGIWHLLQAAHPHHFWQWWEWEKVHHRFHKAAQDFLQRVDTPQSTI